MTVLVLNPHNKSFRNTMMSSTTSSIVKFAAFIMMISFCNIHQVYGKQYAPVLFANHTVNYDPSITFRQDFCDVHTSYYRGEVEIKDVLRNRSLNVAIGDWGGDFFRTTEEGKIDVTNDVPFVVKLLDKLAERAGFTWRESFGYYSVPEEGSGWTDLLVWGVDTFDLLVDFWMYDTQRLNKGVNFLPGWYDASYIMVAQEEVKTESNLLSWLKPFDYKVWIMIIVTFLLSGVIYAALDSLNSSDLRFQNPTNHYFLAGLAMTGQFEFHPTTIATMIFTFSLAALSLILVSAYTANLASFFVVRNTPKLGIKTIDDVVVRQLGICVWATTATDDYLTKRFPSYDKIYRIDSERGVINGISDGTCQVAVTSVSAWESLSNDREMNPGCELSWVGRVIKFSEGAMVTKSDSGAKCSSVVRDSLTFHMEELKNEGFIEQLWKEHHRKTQTQDCDSVTISSVTSSDDSQITLQEIGGAFACFAGLTTIAIVVALFMILRRKKHSTGDAAAGEVRYSTASTAPSSAGSKKSEFVQTIEKPTSHEYPSGDDGISVASATSSYSKEMWT